MDGPLRSKKEMTYHGRTGHPLIHQSRSGKQYIMVRKQGGGTKRLYLDNQGNVPKKHRQKKKKHKQVRKK